MKKILYMISVATVIAGSVAPVLSYHPNSTINIKVSNGIVYSPDTMENLIKNIDNTYNVDWVNNIKAPTMQKLVQNVYDKYINYHIGSLYSQKMIAIDEKVVQTFSNTYTNNSTKAQTFYTQSYSETITNQHSFSWKMTEKLAAKASFTVPFVGGTDFTAEVSSE